MKPLVLESRPISKRTFLPKISVTTYGNFFFSKKALEVMDVKGPTRISICRDEEDSTKYYLLISDDGDIILSPKSAKEPSGNIHIPALTKQILHAFGHIGKKPIYFLLGELIAFEGKNYLPLNLIRDSVETAKLELPKNEPYKFNK